MRPLTDSEIESYNENGFVHLKGFLDPDWLAKMTSAYHQAMFADGDGLNHIDVGLTAEMLSRAGVELLHREATPGAGRFWVRTWNWRKFASIAALGCGAPMPETIALLLGATRINFLGEQLFFKEAGSVHRTAFHQDAPYFHLTGDQCCTVWMPLDVVDAENGMMGYVRGSHRWGMHAANAFASQWVIPGSDLPKLPDIDNHEEDYEVVYCPSEPGDAIIHHVRTVHGATGNTAASRDRRAFALRYVGDDVRYLLRDGSPPDSQTAPNLRNGDLLDSETFPLIWTAADGYVKD